MIALLVLLSVNRLGVNKDIRDFCVIKKGFIHGVLNNNSNKNQRSDVLERMRNIYKKKRRYRIKKIQTNIFIWKMSLEERRHFKSSMCYSRESIRDYLIQ